MLTPNDIANPRRASGYNFVGACGRGTGYQAQTFVQQGDPRYRGVTTRDWNGPQRATALEAAWDYCNHYNGQALAPVVQLKSAGHTGKRDRLVADEEYFAALGYIKDVRAQEAGKQGYVYLIAEADFDFVKVGYSTNPEARVPELQTGNPRPLVLMAKIPGTLADEAAIHARHIGENVLQEWFRPTPALVSEFMGGLV